MSNKTTKELVKEARYLGITGFSRMKKYELEKAIRDANTKGTQTDDKACEKCLREQYKQRLIDEKLYTKKLLDNALRKLSCFVRTAGSDRVVIDGDVELCGNCGTLQSAQVY